MLKKLRPSSKQRKQRQKPPARSQIFSMRPMDRRASQAQQLPWRQRSMRLHHGHESLASDDPMSCARLSKQSSELWRRPSQARAELAVSRAVSVVATRLFSMQAMRAAMRKLMLRFDEKLDTTLMLI